jgi:hypothetical protein
MITVQIRGFRYTGRQNSFILGIFVLLLLKANHIYCDAKTLSTTYKQKLTGGPIQDLA